MPVPLFVFCQVTRLKCKRNTDVKSILSLFICPSEAIRHRVHLVSVIELQSHNLILNLILLHFIYLLLIYLFLPVNLGCQYVLNCKNECSYVLPPCMCIQFFITHFIS